MTPVELHALGPTDNHVVQGISIRPEQLAYLSTPDLAAFLADAPAHPTFTPFAVLVCTAVVGFVSVGTLPKAPGDWWISLLVVDGAHQGRGVGRAAMELVRRMAAEAGGRRLGLSVHPDNLAALGLYRSLGFVFENRVTDRELRGWLQLS